MGTPSFALPSLQVLLDRKEDIIGVVSQPDRQVGRGRHLAPPPVKELALKYNLSVYQPEKIKDPEFIAAFKDLNPDLAVVVAYGQIIPASLLEIPSCGFINVHSSLLPAYRGAAPINWALINGETETGVTIMLLDEGLDTGDIIIQAPIPIEPDDNAAGLHDKLSLLGSRLLGKAVDMLFEEIRWNTTPQDHTLATYAPTFKKDNGLINWEKSAKDILNQVRGMTPWPCCFTYLNNSLLKIHRVELSDPTVGTSPGKILSVSKNGIEVSTGKGSILLKDIQIEGKKKMAAEDFMKGHKITPGTELSNTRLL
jgi:methionyl-tRNA formyltransferase